MKKRQRDDEAEATTATRAEGSPERRYSGGGVATAAAVVGATDLCHRLKSDDPRQVLTALRQFSHTVRRERRVALVVDVPPSSPRCREGPSRGAAESHQRQRDDDEDEQVKDDNDDELASLDSLSDTDDEDDGGDSEDSSLKKKKKHKNEEEEWMKDTRNYNVPFVGTSIAPEKHPVVVGMWPTGLLRAYLIRSPRAVELVETLLEPIHAPQSSSSSSSSSSLSRQLHRGSGSSRLLVALRRAHVDALAELVTAAVPMERVRHNQRWRLESPREILRRHSHAAGADEVSTASNAWDSSGGLKAAVMPFPPNGSTEAPPRFIDEIAKKLVPLLIGSLKDASKATGKSNNSQGTSSGPNPSSGLRELAPSVLRLLINLSKISPSLARQIVRGLESEGGGGPPLLAIVRRLLQFPPAPRHSSLTTSTAAPVHVGTSGGDPRSHHAAKKTNVNDARGDCERTGQSLSSLGVQRAREQRQASKGKIRAIELATVLVEYNHVSILASLVATSSRAQDRKQQQRRPQQNAAGLLTLVFQHGLASLPDDENEDDDSEAGRAHPSQGHREVCTSLIRLLEAVHACLLLQEGKSAWRIMTDLFCARDCLSNLVHLATDLAPPLVEFRDVLVCQDDCDVSALPRQRVGTVARRLLYFLLTDAARSPLLAHKNVAEKPLSHAMIQLWTKQPSGVVIQPFLVHCLETSPQLVGPMLRLLPVPDITVGHGLPFCKALRLLSRILQSSACRQNNKSIEWPLHLRKSHLTKALEHQHVASNPLAASVMLHFITHVLQQHDAFAPNVLVRHLPDPITVVRLIAPTEGSENGSAMNKHHLAFASCSVLPRLVQLSYVAGASSSNVDWVKSLLPSCPSFSQKPVFLQRKIISCIERLLELEKTSAARISSPRTLIEIALSSSDLVAYRCARRTALSLFPRHRTGGPTDDAFSREAKRDIEYEYACWIDGVTHETLDEVCKLIKQSSQELIQSRLALIKAWKGLPGSVPVLNVSPLLVQALIGMAELSPLMRLLVCQVTTCSLLHCSEPTPLAALINTSLAGMAKVGHLEKLQSYALLLIQFDQSKSKIRTDAISSLVRSLFDGHCQLTALVEQRWETIFEESHHTPTEDLAMTFRQMAHIILVSASREQQTLVSQLFQTLLPQLLRINFGGVWIHFKRLLSMGDAALSKDRPVMDLLVRSSARDFSDLQDRYWGTFMELKSLRSERSHASLLSTASVAFVLAPFVPSEFLVQWTQDLLGIVSIGSAFETVAIQYLRRFLSERVHFQQSCEAFAIFLRTLWFNLPFDVASETRKELLRCLDQLLCFFLSLEMPTHVSLCLERDFTETGVDSVVQRCILIETLYRQDDKSQLCLLTKLLECNPLAFAPVVLMKIDSEDSAMLRERFDEAVLLALRCREKSNSHRRAVALASKRYLERSIEILSCLSPNVTKLRSTNLLMAELVSFPSGSDDNEMEVATALEEAISSLLPALEIGTFEKLDNAQQHQLCQLAALLCLRESKFESTPRHALAFTLFTRLSSRLPSEIQACPASSISTIELITKLFDSFHPVLENFDLNSAIVTSLLASLSLVLSKRDNRRDGANISFMKLIHFMLVQPASSTSSQGILKSLASSVLSMIINHSNFPCIISLALDDASESVKFQVLDLLLLCVSTSSETANLHDRFIDTLLKGFNAGTSRCDALTRRLLHAVCCQQPESAQFFAMDRLRWGGLPEAKSGIGLTWLLDAIDPRRVYSTLAAFPVDDPYVVDGTYSPHTEELTLQPFCHEDVSVLAYSPGFILPLILASLDSAFSVVGSSDRLDEEHAKFAHRLSDKGCLALALMSLCSNCGSIRRIATSILSLLTRVVDSEVARQYSPWRERPQIALLLHSVQKAFSIRNSEARSDKLCIPKLPGFTSLFLARACLVLSRPFDGMYPVVNRYFLQPPTDNGAFQDLFRVPGFMSFFNSTAEEPGQARVHRLWALRLIRDGFVDDDCFKPLLSCHAPELLLTSLDSFRVRSSYEAKNRNEEASMLLSTICKILDAGGSKAHEFFAGRLGILYWLRSILLGRPCSELFPNGECIILFMRLIVLVFKHATAYAGKEVLGEWCESTAQPILNLILQAHNESNDGSVHQMERVTSGATEVFSLLGRCIRDRSSQTRSGVLRLQSVINLIHSTPHDAKSKLILGLCNVPLQRPVDLPDAESLFEIVLDALESVKDVERELLLLDYAAELVAISNLELSTGVASRFASLRRRFHQNSSTQSRCQSLLATLVPSLYTTNTIQV